MCNLERILVEANGLHCEVILDSAASHTFVSAAVMKTIYNQKTFGEELAVSVKVNWVTPEFNLVAKKL